jgi:hypothetical protein
VKLSRATNWPYVSVCTHTSVKLKNLIRVCYVRMCVCAPRSAFDFGCLPCAARARAHTFARKLIACLILGRRASGTRISTHTELQKINLDIALPGKLFRSSGLAKGKQESERMAAGWVRACTAASSIFAFFASFMHTRKRNHCEIHSHRKIKTRYLFIIFRCEF